MIKHYSKVILAVILLFIVFIVVPFVLSIKAIDKDNKKNQSNIVGSWYLTSASRNGDLISLTDIYGSSILTFGGILTLNNDGTYSEYIGVYSSEDEDLYVGNYERVDDYIYLTSRSGIKNTLEVVTENKQLFIKEKIDDDTYIFFERKG